MISKMIYILFVNSENCVLKVYMLRRKFHMCSESVKTTLFSSYTVHVPLYTPHSCSPTKDFLRKLDVACNNVLMQVS